MRNGIVEDLMICNGQFYNQINNYSVLFEDDGYVAYAYILNELDEIVGDVWLYNSQLTPKNPEWHNPEKQMPFANSFEFVEDIRFEPVTNIKDVSVKWINENKVKVYVYIRNELFAVLTKGSKPGKSLLTKKNGPLSKVLK